MDKEEYREEVIKQLKRQNDLLDCLVAASVIILLLVLVIMIIEITNMEALSKIAVHVDFLTDDIMDINLSISSIKSDVNVWLQAIADYANKIYIHVK